MSPRAKQIMLLSAACVGMAINAIGFIALNHDRLSYQPSAPTATTGPRIVLLGTVDMTRRDPSMAVAPKTADAYRDWMPAQAWRRERLTKP